MMQKFIMAERSENYHLHIEMIRNMPHVSHAIGYFPHAKACQIYLQDMNLLGTIITRLELCINQNAHDS